MASRGKNTVVVVDDDEDLQNLLVAAFKAKHFDVKSIKTGKAALSYLLDKKNHASIALIILDRLLPDMDGIAILKEFEKSSPGEIPVLILSVLSSEKDILSGFKLGATDYVGKPFNLPILIQKALSLMGK